MCKGTNNFVKACYPPLNNVKGEKAVTACLAPCDGGAEQLTTTNDTNDTNLAASPRTFSRCDVVVKVVMVILVKIDFREMNIVSQRAWHRVT